MNITVTAKMVGSKTGVALKILGEPLVGHGSTVETARAAAIQGVTVWCKALKRHGSLHEALERAGWVTRDDGREEVSVELVVDESYPDANRLAEAV